MLTRRVAVVEWTRTRLVVLSMLSIFLLLGMAVIHDIRAVLFVPQSYRTKGELFDGLRRLGFSVHPATPSIAYGRDRLVLEAGSSVPSRHEEEHFIAVSEALLMDCEAVYIYRSGVGAERFYMSSSWFFDK